MRHFLFYLFIMASPLAADFGMMMFDSPKDWRYADLKEYPKSVKVVVVGKGKTPFPPQINLNTEAFEGTLQDYLKIVKKINEAQKTEWKDLGTIKTEAGDASLSQVDTHTEWGAVRMMHVILIKDSIVYILNVSALKEEFPTFYHDFFKAMRSLRYSTDPIDAVQDMGKRKKLQDQYTTIKERYQTLYQKEKQDLSKDQISTQVFNSEDFQKNSWKPLQELLTKEFSYLGPEWQNQMQSFTQKELFSS